MASSGILSCCISWGAYYQHGNPILADKRFWSILSYFQFYWNIDRIRLEFLGEPAYNLDKELVFGDWTLNLLAISRVVKVMDILAHALLTKK